ncbi:MAG: hypothetical protein P1V35_07570 [Planctomycetota bacterium]|nr:hypothetical protein [Planctomycetota bacterium]
MTDPRDRHTCVLKNNAPTETALIVETAPSWVPWAVMGILGLAGMATLGLRTSHEALAQDRVLGGASERVAPMDLQTAQMGKALVEAAVGLPDQADRS